MTDENRPQAQLPLLGEEENPIILSSGGSFSDNVNVRADQQVERLVRHPNQPQPQPPHFGNEVNPIALSSGSVSTSTAEEFGNENLYLAGQQNVVQLGLVAQRTLCLCGQTFGSITEQQNHVRCGLCVHARANRIFDCACGARFLGDLNFSEHRRNCHLSCSGILKPKHVQ